MKILNRSSNLTFTGTSKDYITKEAVKRANSRLIQSMAGHSIGIESIYEKHNISRPTREQITSAASNAMRKLATTS